MLALFTVMTQQDLIKVHDVNCRSCIEEKQIKMRKTHVFSISKDAYVSFYVCLIFATEPRGNWLSSE